MNSSKSLELAVAIVNWRTADLAIDCLRSVESELAEVPSCRVFIVDNGSGDGSADKIARAIETNGWSSFVTLLALPENGGFAVGNNAAIRAAFQQEQQSPAFVLLLNPDTVVRRGAFRILLDFMNAHQKVGIAGGRSEFPDATPQDCCFRFPNALAEFAYYFRVKLVGLLIAKKMPGVPIPTAPIEIDWGIGRFHDGALGRAR